MAKYRGKLESEAVCPICNHKLGYDRNQLLRAGVTRYYTCPNPKCGAEVRVTPGKPPDSLL